MDTPDTKLKVSGDEIYYDYTKVAIITIPPSTLRDRFLETLFEVEELVKDAYAQGREDGYSEGFDDGVEDGGV